MKTIIEASIDQNFHITVMTADGDIIIPEITRTEGDHYVRFSNNDLRMSITVVKDCHGTMKAAFKQELRHWMMIQTNDGWYVKPLLSEPFLDMMSK